MVRDFAIRGGRGGVSGGWFEEGEEGTFFWHWGCGEMVEGGWGGEVER